MACCSITGKVKVVLRILLVLAIGLALIGVGGMLIKKGHGSIKVYAKKFSETAHYSVVTSSAYKLDKNGRPTGSCRFGYEYTVGNKTFRGLGTRSCGLSKVLGVQIAYIPGKVETCSRIKDITARNVTIYARSVFDDDSASMNNCASLKDKTTQLVYGLGITVAIIGALSFLVGLAMGLASIFRTTAPVLPLSQPVGQPVGQPNHLTQPEPAARP